MPLTTVGEQVMANMRKQYGDKADEVFYASINAGKPGAEKWHKKRTMGKKFKDYHEAKKKGPGE
jgi:hypothetical protein